MGSFPETFNDPKRKDETNANKYYKCMRSDVFQKSTKFHTDNVFAWSLYGVFPGLLGQFTSVTYPRRTGGKRLTFRSDHVTRNALAWGLKGRPFDSARYIFPCKNFSPAGYFFLKSPIPSPRAPQSQIVVPKQITLHYPVLIGRDA